MWFAWSDQIRIVICCVYLNLQLDGIRKVGIVVTFIYSCAT